VSQEERRLLGADEEYCTSCGEAIKKAAEVCPKCGVRLKDLPSTEGKKRSKLKIGCLSIIGIIVAIAIIGVVASSSSGGGDTVPTGPPTPVVVIDANLRDMLELVESNEVAAKAEYKGKWVEFSGVISEGAIEEDKFDLIPTNSDTFQMSGAECKLTFEELGKVIGLRAGQTVTVKGQVKDISTFMITTFEIDKCQILSGN